MVRCLSFSPHSTWSDLVALLLGSPFHCCCWQSAQDWWETTRLAAMYIQFYCSQWFTHIDAGRAIHDSLECVQVQLRSTIVLHLGYGLAEPVQSDTHLQSVWRCQFTHCLVILKELCDEVWTCQLTLLIRRSASFLFTLQKKFPSLSASFQPIAI